MFDEKLAKTIGKLVTHESHGSTAMYLLGRLVDRRPELLNCQLDVLEKVLQAKVAVSQTPVVVTYWSQASLVNEVRILRIVHKLFNIIQRNVKTKNKKPRTL